MRGDAEKLRRVVINLVGNAIDALDESQTPRSPRVDVQMGENLAGTEVWLRVADNGPGIDELSASSRCGAPSTPRRPERHRARARDLQEAGRGPRREHRGRTRAAARAPSSC